MVNKEIYVKTNEPDIKAIKNIKMLIFVFTFVSSLFLSAFENGSILHILGAMLAGLWMGMVINWIVEHTITKDEYVKKQGGD